ncbi:UDP-N-acetylglucosamine 2-epimerase (hydrolyzing) [Thalassotalea sp. LPB0316]|uniref:UDP-N-acetylglucosamine 2-epimerase n=1 Tax=Thalassotalea sp. LPB0316 TaxID=2769490 RepID=UPI0018689E91|nr:UDP-N-acetylglucosamine 2-epimerase [Thalassotalea sp. LPB0316]QOL27081.1 UDP-N-acetylglucosamine 2-epimerase (hydrolyzing) [Thalassotalea sp. LPB0316]
MKKIAVFTGTRAEYGLLYWLLKDIEQSAMLELQLLVSAMHLSPEFGLTKQQIINDGFKIDEEVEMLLSSDSAVGCAKSIGLGIIGYSDALNRLAPDALIVLGDRFEALAVSQTAMMLNIPIIHLHGGELTFGAKDDMIRHAITKFASYHVTANQAYADRVKQLGEFPERILNLGAIGLDHLSRTELLDKPELAQALDFPLQDYFVVTFHSATASDEDGEQVFSQLIAALEQFPDHQVLLSYPNADDSGRGIIKKIDEFAQQYPQRVLALSSFGHQRYLSAIKYASAVIGNSSSGIIEVPAFNVPTVNIGTRQAGRLAAESVFNCQLQSQDIIEAIEQALAWRQQGVRADNPYGQGDVSQALVSFIEQNKLSVKQGFFDLRI